MLSAHPLADRLIKREAEFEEQTGIEVSFEVLPEGDFRTNLNAELASGSDSVDVFMTGPPSNWEYASGGWIADLQPFVDDPAKTAAEWDFADFFEGGIKTNRWTGQEFGGVSEGPPYAIPMSMETYHLTYRKDVLEANSKIASWRRNPSTRFSEAGNRWAEAVQEIHLGGADVTEAMTSAANDINAIIELTR